MLAENFPRQIWGFFFSLASWENEACVHHTVSLSCLFSFKWTEQHSHFLSRKILQQTCAKSSTNQLPKSLILLPAKMRSGQLSSSGSSCWPCWTCAGWPPCMNAPPEQYLLGHSQLLGQAMVAKSHGMKRSWGWVRHLTMRTQRHCEAPWKRALQ